jgi:hypothetical protein
MIFGTLTTIVRQYNKICAAGMISSGVQCFGLWWVGCIEMNRVEGRGLGGARSLVGVLTLGQVKGYNANSHQKF